MRRKKGRPQKYSEEQLKEILLEYAVENIGEIKFQNLAEETGIHRHIWSRRMSKEINELNQKTLSLTPDSFEIVQLPNTIDIVNKYWSNKTAMINALNEFNNYIQDLWEKSVAYEKNSQKEKELLKLLEEKDKEIKYLKELRDYYKNEYQKVAIESTYDHKQKEKNVRNVLDINDTKKMTSSNWKEQFPDLF
ncbi:hypothetical protein A9P44_03545 [Paenibacillus polymyxa]|nr:hypothetical protein [Paenibacillus polymyxa]OBA06005.1 hypothetical protein A9P44_03545 [Paenibacillus polymyxa]